MAEFDVRAWPHERLKGVSLPVPRDWVRLNSAADTMVLSYPEVTVGTFKPNIVVRSLPTSGSLPALGAQALAGILGGIPGSHCISHDRGEIAGRPARGQLFTFSADDYNVLVDRWVFFAGADAVEIAAHYTVEQQEDIAPLFAAVLGGAGVEDVLEHGPMPEPMREPPIDGYLKETSGIRAEDLGRIPLLQPYRPVGPMLTDDAFRLVLEHAGQQQMMKARMLSAAGECAELVAAGLMEPDGTFTPAFAIISVPLREVRRRFVVEGRYGTQTTQLDAWAGGGGVLVATRASHAQLVWGNEEHAVPPGSVRLEIVREGSLTGVVAAWAGLGPAWSVLGRVDQVAPGAFEARLEGAGGPPEDADRPLRRMWEQPWFAWRFSMPGLDMERSWLNAGTAGHFAIGHTSAETMMVQATPSAHVWKTMSQEIGLALQLH
ncbi:hypothetical protein JTF08_01680 [Micrococcaceae bacterium RIT802]|nr:hypothetical protein [Micrococcaceae bacterium RIT 802]